MRSVKRANTHQICLAHHPPHLLPSSRWRSAGATCAPSRRSRRRRAPPTSCCSTRRRDTQCCMHEKVKTVDKLPHSPSPQNLQTCKGEEIAAQLRAARGPASSPHTAPCSSAQAQLHSPLHPQAGFGGVTCIFSGAPQEEIERLGHSRDSSPPSRPSMHHSPRPHLLLFRWQTGCRASTSPSSRARPSRRWRGRRASRSR